METPLNNNEINLGMLLMMAMLAKLEMDLKAAEKEERAFATLENRNIRVKVCLN